MPQPEFESPLPHQKPADNSLKVSRFYFLKNNNAASVPTENVDYKNIQLVKAKRWYIEYYYKIPPGLRPMHNGEEWKRFRVFEDINRKKGEAKEKYADQLLAAVAYNLREDAYNPFLNHIRVHVKKEGFSHTILDALNFFLQNIGGKGVDIDTVAKYKHVANLLLSWLMRTGQQDRGPDTIDDEMIRSCLIDYRRALSWSNRYYNNVMGYMSIMFNYLKKRKKIKHNPCEGLEKLKAISKKHRYYSEEVLEALMNRLKAAYPGLCFAAQFVYYAGVRSSKELISLQVGDILMDRNRIRFRSEGTKGKREDYIYLDPKLKDIIKESGIKNYPGNYYIFTYKEVPGERRSSDQYLQKIFRQVRREMGLGEDYTLYSFKHTRAVHLLLDGAQPVDIMQLFRHTDLATTTKYIRDLGFDLNTKFADKSRDL
jgi:integrase